MTFLKRHVINAFTFARTDLTENGEQCILWHNVVDSPSIEERMVLNEDGTFNRLERRRNGVGQWFLSPLQGSPKFHNSLLEAVKRLGWDINEIWMQPMGLHGTAEYSATA